MNYCRSFEINTEETEYSYKPSPENIVGGKPKNSLPIELRTCQDGRKNRCIYHYRLSEKTGNYAVDLSLCLFEYATDQAKPND